MVHEHRATPPTESAGAARPALPDASTRTRVLRLISTDGPISAADIAARLELTGAAVRRHIDTLLQQGAIAAREAAAPGPRGRGRPARAYVISADGHQALASAYDDLATQALRYLQAHAGPQAVADFARSRAEDLATRYASRLADTADPHRRTQALVEALTEDGYAATARPVGGPAAAAGVQLCQGHCPVQHVAQEFPELCEAEAAAFAELIGAHVQRLATLAGGDHVCTTFVATGPPAATDTAPEPATERSAR